MNIDTRGYDFIDFGYGKGGAYEIARKKFKAKKGISIDIRKECKEQAAQRGDSCIIANVLNCTFSPKSVNFVSMVHFLEHLTTMADVAKAISLAAAAAKDFIFVEGPAFEYNTVLEKYGLKFHWADWYGHPSHVTATTLIKMLKKQEFYGYMLFYLDNVVDSSDRAIYPANAVGNQHEYYSKRKHPPKKLIVFSECVYKYFIVYGFPRKPTEELKQKLKQIRARAILFCDKEL
jgi:hypothetical protein